MVKKEFALIIAVLLMGFMIAGCSTNKQPETKPAPKVKENESMGTQTAQTTEPAETIAGETIDIEGVDTLEEELNLSDLDSFSSDLEGFEI